MNFLRVITDMESYAAKFEKDLASLWKKAPNIEYVASTTLEFAAPLIETAFTLEAGAAAGADVTDVLNEVEQKLVAAKGLIKAVGATPDFASVISAAQSDLSDLLTLGGLKNPTSVAHVKLVVGELSALSNALPAATPAVAGATA